MPKKKEKKSKRARKNKIRKGSVIGKLETRPEVLQTEQDVERDDGINLKRAQSFLDEHIFNDATRIAAETFIEQLYRSYSNLSELITKSQRIESEMNSSLRNSIRCVESQNTLMKVVSLQRSRFYERKQKDLDCTDLVPSRIAVHILELIMKSRYYQDSVRFIPNTRDMEATVVSRSDPSVFRRVVLSNTPQTPPQFCAYSVNWDGFSCWNGVDGPIDMHKFIVRRNLNEEWKAQYEGIEFTLPPKFNIDRVISEADKAVRDGVNVNLPVAICSPRGRLPKNASKRLQNWYENGLKKRSKRRKYTCYLCASDEHTAKSCTFRQIDDGEDGGEEAIGLGGDWSAMAFAALT